MYRIPFSTAPAPSHVSEAPAADDPAPGRDAVRIRRRALLLVGSVLLAAAPLALFEPAAYWGSAPELFTLLRGMGGIKAGLAALALAIVYWRLGRTATPRFAAITIGSVWVLALATGLIWELTAALSASALFHAATIVLLLAAWRESGPILTR